MEENINKEATETEAAEVTADTVETETQAEDAGCCHDEGGCSEGDSQKKDKKCKGDGKKQKARADKLEKELAEAAAKLAESEDKYLRILAEYDNFRRRSAEERKAVYADAMADAVTQLLPLLDNLERATDYTDAEKVAEGVKMILGTVPDVLEKMNIKTFGEAGEQFDPNLHNAVMHVEDEEHGENEIIDVFQKGYSVGDKVIRYAMVRVAN